MLSCDVCCDRIGRLLILDRAFWLDPDLLMLHAFENFNILMKIFKEIFYAIFRCVIFTLKKDSLFVEIGILFVKKFDVVFSDALLDDLEACIPTPITCGPKPAAGTGQSNDIILNGKLVTFCTDKLDLNYSGSCLFQIKHCSKMLKN